MGNDDDALGMGIAAAAIGGIGGLLGWAISEHIGARRRTAERELALANELERHVDRAKRQLGNDRTGADLLTWSLATGKNGEYRYAAPVDRGEYKITEVATGRYEVGYTRYMTYYTRPIHEDTRLSECIVAAYRDAQRGRFLGHRVQWKADDTGRVHAAESDDMLVRVRATPWPDVFNLFLLPVKRSRIAFFHVDDGELDDLKAYAAIAISDGIDDSVLPAVALPTDRGALRWSYSDTNADVIALAEFGETRLELGYGPQAGEYELRVSSGQVLARSSLRRLLTEPRTLPSPGREASTTFAEVVSTRQPESTASSSALARRVATPAAPRDDPRVDELERAMTSIAEFAVQQARRNDQQHRERAEENARLTREVDGLRSQLREQKEILDTLKRAAQSTPAQSAPPEPAPTRPPENNAVDWGRHVRGLRARIPSGLPTGQHDAIRWTLEALAVALRSGDDLEDICGSQRKIAAGLARYCDADAPERHCLGKALKWVSSVSPLAIRENRQRWIVPLGQLDTLTLDPS